MPVQIQMAMVRVGKRPITYKYLQDALHEPPVYGDQIWVAEGTYTPTSDYGLDIGYRGKHFRMINGVEIYGGFPDAGDPAWEEHDPNQYETILSGDLLGNDDPNAPVEDLLDAPCRADNCYHVFYHPDGLDLDPNAILDGFTITAGNANITGFHQHGGGMYNDPYSRPTVTGCIFSGNSAESIGGAICYSYYDTSTLTLINCTLAGNSAPNGSAIACDSYNQSYPSTVELQNCILWDGGNGIWGMSIGNEYPDPENVCINMGAYGGTAEASRSPSNWSIVPDINNDGVVEIKDYTIVSGYFGQTGENLPGDFNHDGVVGVATALVHEVYIRLVGTENPRWDNKGHFFMAAADAMRRILIENARRKKSLKYGGDFCRVELNEAVLADSKSFFSKDLLPLWNRCAIV